MAQSSLGCKCCKFKTKFRNLVAGFINNDLWEDDLQKLRSYAKLSRLETFLRPETLRELDQNGTTTEWCRRPNVLQEILKTVLWRFDLAAKHQELLDKYPVVIKCLQQQFPSNESSPEAFASGEAMRHPTQESMAANIKTDTQKSDYTPAPLNTQQQVLSAVLPTHYVMPVEETASAIDQLQSHTIHEEVDQNSSDPQKNRFSTLSTTSSGLGEERQRTLSDATTTSFRSRNLSVSSVMTNRSSACLEQRERFNSIDSGLSFDINSKPTSLESNEVNSLRMPVPESLPLKAPNSNIPESFCSKCREWLTETGTPDHVPSSSPAQYSHSLSSASTATSNSDSDEGSIKDDNHFGKACTATDDTLSMSSDETVSQIHVQMEERLITILGKIEIKRKELVKNMEALKHGWSKRSKLFPKELEDHPVQYRMRLECLNSLKTNSSNNVSIKLSVDLTPCSNHAVEVPPLQIAASIYATDKKLAESNRSSDLNLANKIDNTEEMTISKSTNIVVFPELITLDELKKVKYKFIVIEVSVMILQADSEAPEKQLICTVV